MTNSIYGIKYVSNVNYFGNNPLTSWIDNMSLIQPCQKSDYITNRIYKQITLFLFFILPNIITKTFINLSILAVIYDIRNVTFSTDHLNTDKIRSLLQISVSEEILLLPGYTIHWFWNDSFLNTVTTVHGKDITLRELIINNELFFTHLRTIIDLFVANLPNLLKIKMGLMKARNRIEVKKNLMHIILHS